MAECRHIEVEQGCCIACGACVHELVLNGVCYDCGLENPEVAFKSGEPQVIAAETLLRPKPDRGPK